MKIELKRPEVVERAQKASAKKDWYRIANKSGDGPTELYIYDEIGFWGVTATDLVADLKAVTGDIVVHISSPGGEVFDGIAIYQALKSHKGDVTVMIDSLAASIASVIALAGDRVVMAPKAQYMIHDAFTMAAGNASEMRETANLLDRISDNIASIYADKTGQPVDFWREVMSKDTWYSAEEALAAGLVDEIEGQPVEEKAESFGLAASTFKHADRDSAPAPAIKPEPVGAKHSLVKDVTQVTPEAKVEEEAPFTWDFAAFKRSLKEGMNA